VQGMWQIIVRTVQIHTRAQYEHLHGLSDNLVNVNRTVYLAALVWWIACLWFDEPRVVHDSAVTDVPSSEGDGEIPELEGETVPSSEAAPVAEGGASPSESHLAKTEPKGAEPESPTDNAGAREADKQ